MASDLSIPVSVFDRTTFTAALAEQDSQLIALCLETQTNVRRHLDDAFKNGADIQQLITLRSQFIDDLLSILWQQQDWPNSEAISLVAVGGYGRSELFPRSDIDLLILLDDDANPDLFNRHIQRFITLLWDIKLDIGHSVRSVKECAERAAEDITIATNLIESRLITGPNHLLQQLNAAVSTEKMWPSDQFFRAKRQEQIQRHNRFTNNEYNLEPNVKNSPGGLRDLQTIGWIAMRHFATRDFSELAKLDFLAKEEISTLTKGRNFMWRVRYALHMLADREEDRLLFDFQREIAKLFGYEDSNNKLAIEQFMQHYYRWVGTLSGLNELLIQNFDEAILRACEPENILEINTRFRIHNKYLEACNDKVFEKYPSALLEIFALLAKTEHVKGVRASTIRLIRDHRDLIDDEFREHPRNKKLFMEILRGTHKVSLQIRRMQRYGILGRYLPEFKQVIGQMQHDLFHIYTVDAHTLEVLRNMRRFFRPDMQQKFPIACRIVKRMQKPELLYISGIYHDIGKGRGGDHSQLGAVDAEAFCQRHMLSTQDTNLVVWLVKNHLVMSSVSQRQDISDPDVIHNFAVLVGDLLHLDYLYVLTVADINATNPTLWNSWRASLLRQLYAETSRALRRGLENPVDKVERIQEVQDRVVEQLKDQGFSEEEVRKLWVNQGEDYFLREKVDDIIWHTISMSENIDADKQLIAIKKSSEANIETATQIFVHVPNRDHLFAVIAATLEQLDLSIVDARIYSSHSDYSMDTFFVLDANGDPIGDDPQRFEQIKATLTAQLSNVDKYPEIVKRRTPRQMRFFSYATQTTMFTDTIRGHTVLEVIAPDRPGLLAIIGRIFVDFGIQLQNAKITTLGERVEDVFFITDKQQKPIQDLELCEQIQQAIRTALDEQINDQN